MNRNRKILWKIYWTN